MMGWFNRKPATAEDVALLKERNRHREASERMQLVAMGRLPMPPMAKLYPDMTDEQVERLTESIVRKIMQEYDLVPKQKDAT